MSTEETNQTIKQRERCLNSSSPIQPHKICSALPCVLLEIEYASYFWGDEKVDKAPHRRVSSLHFRTDFHSKCNRKRCLQFARKKIRFKCKEHAKMFRNLLTAVNTIHIHSSFS